MRLPKVTAVVSALILALVAGSAPAHATPSPQPTPITATTVPTPTATLTPVENPTLTPPEPTQVSTSQPSAEQPPADLSSPSATPDKTTGAPSSAPSVRTETPTPTAEPSVAQVEVTPDTSTATPRPMERIQGTSRAIGSTNLITVDLVASTEPGVLYELPQSTAPWFSLVGLTWDSISGPAPHLSVRARVADEWAEWHEVDLDQAAGAQGATDPIFVERADAIEVRVSGDSATSIANPQIVLVSSPERTSDATVKPSATAQRRVQPANAVGYLPVPRMVSRAQWGAAPLEAGCDAPADTIRGVVVHHTAGSNTYSQAQAPSIVRGIQSYHVSLGWCDVGYNFLVDKYGTAYEGRGGGILLPVFGYHATSWNRNTLGISVMMNSGTSQANKFVPSPAVIDAMASIIAWKLAGNYRDPNSTVTIAGKTTPIIFRHGDVMATACPGVGITEQMGNLRNLVNAKMAQVTPSPIASLYKSLGGSASFLGLPHEMEHSSGDGRVMRFTGGIATTSVSGTFATNGAIGNLYENSGAETGPLRFIAGEMTNRDGMWQQDFGNGAVVSGRVGTIMVSGGIYWTWYNTGRWAGPLGYPVADMTEESYGWRQNFENGSIIFDRSTGARVVTFAANTSPKPLTAFIAAAVAPAQHSQASFHVPASVSLAQAILESASGTSELARYAHAYFGIKCGAATPFSNQCYTKVSKEYLNGMWIDQSSQFRAYTSATNSFMDHAHYLRNNARYQAAFSTTNADAFARAIHAAGYATDPDYANKLIGLMRDYDLYRFDDLNTAARVPAVTGGIGAKYYALGGETSKLGYALGDEYAPSLTVRTVNFDTGQIMWSDATGAHFMSVGPIWDTYRFDKNLRTTLGIATGDSTNVGAGWYQTFEGGRLSWHPNYGTILTSGQIEEAYEDAGGAAGNLGFPTAAAIRESDGSWTQTFQGGSLSTRVATPPSTDPLHPITTYYNALGAAANELGAATTGIVSTTDGAYQRFQSGTIYWTAAVGAHVSRGGIGAYYEAYGAERSNLGYPTTEILPGANNGYYQRFQSGTIYWAPGVGSYTSRGGIGAYYEAYGAERSNLGYPTTEILPGANNGYYQRFQSGTIYWAPGVGSYTSRGGIGAVYTSIGADRSRLGYPTSEIRWDRDSWVQDFQHGRISIGPRGVEIL